MQRYYVIGAIAPISQLEEERRSGMDRKITKVGTRQRADNSITHGVKESINDFKLNYLKHLLSKEEQEFFKACVKAEWNLNWKALSKVALCNQNVEIRQEVKKQVG